MKRIKLIALSAVCLVSFYSCTTNNGLNKQRTNSEPSAEELPVRGKEYIFRLRKYTYGGECSVVFTPPYVSSSLQESDKWKIFRIFTAEHHSFKKSQSDGLDIRVFDELYYASVQVNGLEYYEDSRGNKILYFRPIDSFVVFRSPYLIVYEEPLSFRKNSGFTLLSIKKAFKEIL